MGEFFIKLDTIVWSNPIIFLILGSAVFFTIILKGGSKYQASDSVIIRSK